MDVALLDTDALSELLKQKNARTAERASRYIAEHDVLAFSAITRYEVSRGLIARSTPTRLERFRKFCEQAMVVSVSEDILDRAAELWAEATRLGRARTDADLIIAATALVLGRTLVTGNGAHFLWIEGLKVDDWRWSRARLFLARPRIVMP